METYKMVLIAFALGLILAILYALGIIPAWFGIAIGCIGGILIHKILG